MPHQKRGRPLGSRGLRDEARLEIIDQRHELVALAKLHAHIGRRLAVAYRYNGMSLEKLRRAQNLEDGLPEWADVSLVPDVEPERAAA